MTKTEIRKLEELISRFKGHEVVILKHKLTCLTAPGDNYFSTMVRVKARIRNEESGDEETLRAIAKCADVFQNSAEGMLKFFIPFMYKNEYKFYTEILPTLKKFQLDHEVGDLLHFIPELYAARLNLNGSEIADHDAIILLENLVENGYSNTPRHIGFDLEGAEIILKDLAAFHGVALALRLKNPQLFQEKIRDNCKRLDMPSLPEGPPLTPSYQVWLDILQDYDTCAPYLLRYNYKLQEMSESIVNFFKRFRDEPFATLIHCDVWIKNTMQKRYNGRIIKNKLLDLQTYSYGSPAHDVVFFLYTSVQTDVLRSHFDHLLEYYHANLLEVLKKFECDITAFSYEAWLGEIKKVAPREAAGRTPHMMLPVFGKKSGAVDISRLMVRGMKKEKIPQAAKDRIRFIVENLGQRGWL